MITISDVAVTEKTFGKGAGEKFPSGACSIRRGEGGMTISIQLSGDFNILSGIMRTYFPGSTALPEGFSLAEGYNVVLVDSVLLLADGGLGTLDLTYRALGACETAADVGNGILSRSVSMGWVERQETLEHAGARLASQKGDAAGEFNGNLLRLWIQEEDPARKAAYQVRILMPDSAGGLYDTGEYATLDAAFTGAQPVTGMDGSPITKALAQRLAMGVEYATMLMCQIIVREVWWKAPQLSANVGMQLAGVPTEHRPAFGFDGVTGGFAWMLASDSIDHTPGSHTYARTVIYLGVPTTLKPGVAPEFWGTGPIDELLHPKVSSSSGGGSAA